MYFHTPIKCRSVEPVHLKSQSLTSSGGARNNLWSRSHSHNFSTISRRSFILSGQLKHFRNPHSILFPVVPILLGEDHRKISQFLCQTKTSKLDLGQSEVNLKVVKPYYESWQKILRLVYILPMFREHLKARFARPKLLF